MQRGAGEAGREPVLDHVDEQLIAIRFLVVEDAGGHRQRLLERDAGKAVAGQDLGGAPGALQRARADRCDRQRSDRSRHLARLMLTDGIEFDVGVTLHHAPAIPRGLAMTQKVELLWRQHVDDRR